MSGALKKVDNFRRKILQQLLDKCTEGQRKVFVQMYGTTDAYKLSDDDVNWAIEQCDRTVTKNKKP